MGSILLFNLDNRASGRISKNILGKNASVDGAEAFYQSYQDTGIFGIRVSGSSANVFKSLFRQIKF